MSNIEILKSCIRNFKNSTSDNCQEFLGIIGENESTFQNMIDILILNEHDFIYFWMEDVFSTEKFTSVFQEKTFYPFTGYELKHRFGNVTEYIGVPSKAVVINRKEFIRKLKLEHLLKD